MSDWQRLEQLIAERFTGTSMSADRWRAVLHALHTLTPRPTICRWKFVDDPRIFATPLPGPDGISGTQLTAGSLQPFPYERIEWLEIVYAQPDRVQDALADIAGLEASVERHALRVFGYR